MTATADGWIHYAHTLASFVSGATTTLIQGTIGPAGDCVFSSASGTTADGSSGYSEQTGYDPVTCQATVVSGQLSAAGRAKLSGASATAGAVTAGADAASAPAAPKRAAGTRTAGGAAKAVAAAAAGSWAAFEKVSYVDPLDITITSLVDNLSWSGNGVPASSNGKITGGSASAVSYKFAYDNWTTSAITFAWRGCIGCTYLTSQAAQTFYNRDFEAVIVAIMGLAGYAACGFDSSAATFYLSPWTEGYPNGYFSWGHSNSVKGGCSDLVHFRENHGSGHSA